MVGARAPGRARLDGSSKKEAWLAVPKRGKSREGLACLAVPQEGARARGGNPSASVPER